VPQKKAAIKKRTPGPTTQRFRKGPDKQEHPLFPVVGIGASAGGLEAFSELLEHLPSNLGMAYVYIPHLSPDHESFLPQILERKTGMKVWQAENNMHVEKDAVYVIPSNHNLEIKDGLLKLTPRLKALPFHPIDQFFSTLASVYKENAIGIVLSGTATDGSLGLKAIKAEGGITFAQDDTARYISMPHYAAEMGYVDFVMPPTRIAKELASLIKYPYSRILTQNEYFKDHKAELRKIHLILLAKRDVDFSHYKETTIHRRIIRRMLLSRLENLDQYIQLLKSNKSEVDALYQDLLITVTNFFRDKTIYDALTHKILPDLLKDRQPSDALRIWIPGCATGEEAVSFAIVLLEYIGEKAASIPIQIFATDLNEKAIERARTGIYSKSLLQNVSPERIKRFFTKIDGSYQVIKQVRDICIFAPHNLLKDPPFSKIDIISCQNLLIYLEATPQNRIMHTFHYALKPNGYLLLGKSETIGSATDIFEQFTKDSKVYTKKDSAGIPKLDFVPRFSKVASAVEGIKRIPHTEKALDLEKQSEKLLLDNYAPTSVLVNKDLDILRFRGSTSRFLEAASGKASLNLMKMIRDDLAYELRSLLRRAKKEQQLVKKENLQVGHNGLSSDVTLEVIPINSGSNDINYLVVFRDGVPFPEQASPQPGRSKKSISESERRIIALENELKDARQNVKIITEEFETTREELQSANEEVLSSNEELQSINEELETSKEELQSTNEELTTINEELHNRNNELRQTSEYAEAILQTVHEAILLLNNDLRVQKANRGFYDLFKTTPDLTEGYYLHDLGNSQWDIPVLRKQLKLVQSKGQNLVNFEVDHEFPDIGRKVMLLNAESLQLKEQKHGLWLLAMQDITERKKIVSEILDKEENFRLMLQNSYDIITVFDKDGTIKYQSAAVENILGFKPEERIGKNIFQEKIIHPQDKAKKESMIREAIALPDQNIHAEIRMQAKDGRYRIIDAVVRNMLSNERINGILATYRDITDRKQLEQQKDDFIGIASHELKTPVTSIKAYAEVLQLKFMQLKDKDSAQLAKKMEKQVDRLTFLINDLLDITKISEGQLQLNLSSFDINALVREKSEEIQRIATGHKIILKLGRPRKVWGDKERTGQVVLNILSNAVKYSPKGKRVIISTEADKENVTVSIQDFGVGIDMELRKKIFDRFFRLNDEQHKNFPGMGLGLYIAAELIRKQDGKIWVNSTKGKGSTFHFTLPVRK
jgi:two-component system CheB/CheR fusion protein